MNCIYVAITRRLKVVQGLTVCSSAAETLLLFAVIFFTVLLMDKHSLHAAPFTPRRPPQQLSQINVRKFILGPAFSPKCLGFTNTNQFVIATNYSDLGGVGAFKWIDCRSGEVVQSLPTNTINTDTAIMSSDGHTIFASDNLAFLLGKLDPPIVNHVRILNSKNLKPMPPIDVGFFRDSFGISETTARGKILVSTCSLVPDKDKRQGFDYVDFCLEAWDWKAHKLLRRTGFRYATDVDYIVSPSDGSEYCCAVIDNQSHIYGNLTFLDPITGRELRRIRGNEQNPVDNPVFYLPDGRLVCKNKVYDPHGIVGKLLLPDHPELRCVSGALSHLNLVFFQSEAGLELWNVKKKQLVERWPQIKTAIAVYVTLDQSVMGVSCSPDVNKNLPMSENNVTTVQFWALNTLSQ